jgi:Asp/Glu/hydantoin racemase
MTTRLLVLSVRANDVFDGERLEVVRPHVAADTEVVVRSLAGSGVPGTAFLPAASLFLNQLLQAVEQGERDGFDAVVIACCSDPGLEDAKDLVSIPVTAPMEAAVATSLGLGRLGVVAPRIESGEGENLPQDANWVRRLVHRYGGERSFAGVWSARAGHPSREDTARWLVEDPERLREGVRREMAASIAGPAGEAAETAWRDGDATVLFFACTLWGGLLDPIQERMPVPVLDPLVTPVRYAELLARAGHKS